MCAIRLFTRSQFTRLAPLLLPLPIVFAALLLRPSATVCLLPSHSAIVDWPAPPAFINLPAGSERKQAFVAYLLPLVEAENARINSQRTALQCLLGKSQGLSSREQNWLQTLASEYRVTEFAPNKENTWQALLRKVDRLPASLVLAQGANESAWGTSRFAREANNLFGLWCFEPGCGLVPLNRPQGSTYEVQRFVAPEDSVRSYMRTLNSHRAYQPLRAIRAQAAVPTGVALAEGLGEYSIRGEAYIEELQQMIRYNQWQGYDAGE
ncbi:glucosaminidase domain-containing protein [Porticoccus sp. GXU_MW_L64]